MGRKLKVVDVSPEQTEAPQSKVIDKIEVSFNDDTNTQPPPPPPPPPAEPVVEVPTVVPTEAPTEVPTEPPTPNIAWAEAQAKALPNEVEQPQAKRNLVAGERSSPHEAKKTLVKCPKCNRSMTEKTLRYTHEAKCNQTPGVKRRTKSQEVEIKPEPAAVATSPPPVVKQTAPMNANPVRDRLQERHSRIQAKKESYKQLVVNSF